jgi:hypothetical protein
MARIKKTPPEVSNGMIKSSGPVVGVPKFELADAANGDSALYEANEHGAEKPDEVVTGEELERRIDGMDPMMRTVVKGNRGILESLSEGEPLPPFEPEPELEMDPGEMVSLWYQLKKAYDDGVKAIKSSEEQLNAVAVSLRDKFSISVPQVSFSIPTSNASRVKPFTPVVGIAPIPEDSIGDDIATPTDFVWSPPEPRAITGSVPYVDPMVARLRRDAATADGDERGFAAQIANRLGRLGK